MTRADALRELERGAGPQFAPLVIDAFATLADD